MASDERDRKFDKALGRHLRSAAASDGPADAASRRGSCPDAETLAAYHERSLLPEELNSWKTHIVSCARCQGILAELEATDQISLGAAGQEENYAMKESLPAKTDHQLEAAPTGARTRASRLSRGPRWRWLAPAGAIAASLLVWIAMHEDHPLRLPTGKDAQISQKQTLPAPSPSPAPTAPPAAQTREESTNKLPAAADQITAYGRLQSKVPKLGPALSDSAPLAAKLPAGREKEKALQADEKREAKDQLQRGDNPLVVDGQPAVGATTQSVEVQAAAPSVPAEPMPLSGRDLSNLQMQSPPPPAPASKTVNRAKAALPPASPAKPASGGPANSYALNAMMETVRVLEPGLIAVPGSPSLWRAGRAGLIEFSSDGGKSWSRQTSSVLVDLTSGYAPSDKVCWIVGRVGVLLLTIDGGAHWKLLTPPLTDDLGGVRATDALHATIWNLRNTRSFETADGGLTWKPVPSP